MALILPDGTSFPDIPADGFDTYHNGVMVKADMPAYGLVIYLLALSSSEVFFVPSDLTGQTYGQLMNSTVPWGQYTWQVGTSSDWGDLTQNTDATIELPVDTILDGVTYSIVWANHDIKTATGTDDSGNYIVGDVVYYRNSEFQYEECYSEKTAWYKTIADHARRLGGTARGLTTEEIASIFASVSRHSNGVDMTQSNIDCGNEPYHGNKPICFANGMWVAAVFEKSYDTSPAQLVAEKSGLYYSMDGKTWEKGNVSGGYTDVYYHAGIWVAGSAVRYDAETSGGTESCGLVYSVDGKVWTRSNITDFVLEGIVYANERWVAYSNGNIEGTPGGILFSTDGMNWTKVFSAGAYNVAYGNGVWVAGHFSNEYGFTYSTDGQTWEFSNISNETCYDVVFGDGIFVAATSGAIYYSEDGKTWTQSMDGVSFCHNITYNNRIWVMGTNGSGIYYSTDGKTWTQSNVTSGSFSWATNRTLWANGVYVILSNEEEGIYYSTDGKTWAQSNVASGGGNYCTYGNGVFLASVGLGNYYSADGTVWYPCSYSTSTAPVCGHNLWVAFVGGLCYSVTWEP